MSYSKASGKNDPERLKLLFGLESAFGRLKVTGQSGSGAANLHDEAERFAQNSLHVDADALLAEVDRLLAQGASVESIYIELLAPAARLMGVWWERDECDFIEVTMGLWRIQEVMQEMSAREPSTPRDERQEAMRALFLPMPGDQHVMGPQVLKDMFVRSGWDAIVMTKPLRKEVLGVLSSESFDVVGLTLSRDCPSAAIKNIIKAMRSVSRNEHIRILVGGHMINQNPAIVAEVGADGTGADARAALDAAEALVQSATVRAQNLT